MRFSDLKKIFARVYATYTILANGIEFHFVSTAITANSTLTSSPAGSFGITSHATGRGLLFYSDGTKWQASDATSVPVKATGAEINTGTNDAKFATPLAIADSNVAFVADVPVKATGAEVNTGTDDAKFVTALAIEDSDYAKTAAIPVKATGAEINTGTDDAKFVTPLAIADSTINRGNTAAYDKTTAGAQTLLGGNPTVRQTIIRVEVTESFAAGDGAATIFAIGETGTADKFKASLNTGTAGDVLTFGGVLSGDAALLVTGTAATGTTSTGAITVTAIAVPDGS